MYQAYNVMVGSSASVERFHEAYERRKAGIREKMRQYLQWGESRDNEQLEYNYNIEHNEEIKYTSFNSIFTNVEFDNKEISYATKQLKYAMLKVFDDEHFDIFISHSHKDFQVAVNLAGWLEENYGIKCFIDALYWENIDDLICRRFCCNSKAIKNASVILTTALTDMIRKCDCLFLLNTPNAVSDGVSSSPWIFHEIYTSKVLSDIDYSKIYDMRKKLIISDDMKFAIDLSYMPVLGRSNLEEWAHEFSHCKCFRNRFFRKYINNV